MTDRILLGIDLGTTHCKAGACTFDGKLLAVATRPTPLQRTGDGLPFHDPEALIRVAAEAVREARSGLKGAVGAVGVTSMAEAGLLVERDTGRARTHVIPWFDRRAAAEVEALERLEPPDAAFRRSGLHPSFKFALPKLLWLRARDEGITRAAVWLSTADYLVYRLTGEMATDATLAARTAAYSLLEGRWDNEWIERAGLRPDLFPPILPAGAPAGRLTDEEAHRLDLPPGIPVAVCGHDHLCAAAAAGVLEPGPVLDSIGTAESLLGVLAHLALDQQAYLSGLAFVPHVLPGRFCWLGGLSAAGGSIEWLRALLGPEPVPYGEIVRLAGAAPAEPTGILYLPYLSGSGAPLPDGAARAAFLGLSAEHGRPHLVKAVLEGTAYAAEGIRRAAGALLGATPTELVVVGGGARNRRWMEIKADVHGCRIVLPALGEAALVGAALLAGVGAGLLAGARATLQRAAGRARAAGVELEANARRHAIYSRLYERGFLGVQGAVRGVSGALEADGHDG